MTEAEIKSCLIKLRVELTTSIVLAKKIRDDFLVNETQQAKWDYIPKLQTLSQVIVNLIGNEAIINFIAESIPNE